MKNFADWPGHQHMMAMALALAQTAGAQGDVPVGALVLNSAGEICAQAANSREQSNDPTAHAEMECLRAAGKQLGSWRLAGCTMYVTLEPCLMCLAAMYQARLELLVFGAYDPKAGALSLGYLVPQDRRLNHRFAVIGGIRQASCAQLLTDFFRQRRREQRQL